LNTFCFSGGGINFRFLPDDNHFFDLDLDLLPHRRQFRMIRAVWKCGAVSNNDLTATPQISVDSEPAILLTILWQSSPAFPRWSLGGLRDANWRAKLTIPALIKVNSRELMGHRVLPLSRVRYHMQRSPPQVRNFGGLPVELNCQLKRVLWSYE
jgi:hypothetical protein